MHAPTSVYSQDFRLANSALQYSLPYLHELFILESAIDVGNTRHMRNDLLLPVSHHTPLLKNKLNLCNFTYDNDLTSSFDSKKVIFWTFLNIKLWIYVLSRPSICCFKVMDENIAKQVGIIKLFHYTIISLYIITLHPVIPHFKYLKLYT